MSNLNKDTDLFGDGSFSHREFQDLNERNVTQETNRVLKEIRDSIRGNPGGMAFGAATAKGLYDFNHGF